MKLTEENYIATINSYSFEHWQPLFDLIPEIENTQDFAEVVDVDKPDKFVIQMPLIAEKPIVSRFREVIYQIPIIIAFSWASWDEGRKIANTDDFDFDTIDVPTKCKLISAIVRNDRFCEGALVSAFNSSLILKILQSIQRQVG